MIIELYLFGDIIDIQGKKICVIIPKESKAKIIGVNKLEINTNYIDLYVSDKMSNTLQIKQTNY